MKTKFEKHLRKRCSFNYLAKKQGTLERKINKQISKIIEDNPGTYKMIKGIFNGLSLREVIEENIIINNDVKKPYSNELKNHRRISFYKSMRSKYKI